MRGMENTEQNQTTVAPMTVFDVVERASTEDLKHLAAIGITALVATKGANPDDFSGGDFIEKINQVIYEVAPEIAPAPSFLPTDEETSKTGGQVWRERMHYFMWDLG